MDFNKAATLLHVVDRASSSPALSSLRNTALNALLEMNKDAEKELAEVAAKAAEEEARKKAEAEKEAAKSAPPRAVAAEDDSSPKTARRF